MQPSLVLACVIHEYDFHTHPGGFSQQQGRDVRPASEDDLPDTFQTDTAAAVNTASWTSSKACDTVHSISADLYTTDVNNCILRKPLRKVVLDTRPQADPGWPADDRRPPWLKKQGVLPLDIRSRQGLPR